MRIAIALVFTFFALMGGLAMIDNEGGWRGWLRETLELSGVFLAAAAVAAAILVPFYFLWMWAI